MMNEISNVINNSISITFKEVLEYKIFSLSKYSLTVYEVVGALVILMIGLVVSKIIRRLIYKSERFDLGKKFAFSQVFHYVIVIIMFFLVMKVLGVDISPLLVGSSVILVGIGLGLQNLFLDFISGVIILLDRTIQVGCCRYRWSDR
jgi:small-conductance mechanosensitive channel